MSKRTAVSGPVGEHIAANVEVTSVARFLETKNLAYMLYTNTSRAIPLVTSGVKPGAQRLIFSMFQDKVLPGSKPRKSAKLTSAATGAYHPHGQAAMYGAMATMAQNFTRVPLIEGIGSFGLAPGDLPAADRYTEARLSKAGLTLVSEVADGGVPMRKTYDGEHEEPWYLPAKFPALLCVGAVGIGEGWATTLPQHNPRDVMEAAVTLLDSPEISDDELFSLLKGPDWGTGGRVVGSLSGIHDYLRTGKGKLTVQGKVIIDKGRFFIVEVPPEVAVPAFLNKDKSDKQSRPGLCDHAKQGTIQGISDVSDFTDEEHGLYIEVTVKRGFNVSDVVADVMRVTDLERTYSASMVALDRDLVPRWWTARELLTEFISMRDDVVVARSLTKLKKLRGDMSRAEAVAAVVLDKEITTRIIQDAETKAQASSDIASHFHITEEQSLYVVELPLYRLTKASIIETQQRLESLIRQVAELEGLVKYPEHRRVVIREELVETATMFEDPIFDRRTVLDHDAQPAARDAVELSDNERLSLWKLDTETFGLGETGENIPEGKSVWVVFTDGKIKRFEGRGLPKSITLKPIAPQLDRVFATGIYDPSKDRLVIVTAGANKSQTSRVLYLDTSDINSQGIAGNGVAGIKLGEEDHIVNAFTARAEDNILTVSDTGWKITPLTDIPLRTSGGSQGVGVHRLTQKEEGVIIAEGGKAFVINDKSARASKRATSPHRERVESWKKKAES